MIEAEGDLQIVTIACAPKRSTLESILSDLQAGDWEKQNAAVEAVSEMIESNARFVETNLRPLVVELVEITRSPRSALQCLSKCARPRSHPVL
jgi:hypothetical protein